MLESYLQYPRAKFGQNLPQIFWFHSQNHPKLFANLIAIVLEYIVDSNFLCQKEKALIPLKFISQIKKKKDSWKED